MENNMKYIKLYENFQEKKPISNKDWNEFSKVNKRFKKKIWVKKNLFDNGDGTFDYYGSLKINLPRYITFFWEFIPLPIKRVYGNLDIVSVGLRSLKDIPSYIEGNLYIDKCEYLLSFKYIAETKASSIVVSYYTNGNLLSHVDDPRSFINKPVDSYSKNSIELYLKSEYFVDVIWFEALAFVGARDPEAYIRVCNDFPEETIFTNNQVNEFLNHPWIDRKSTEDDWNITKDILTDMSIRMKRYDHSEYRDSKLDSEWKEIF